MIKLLTKLTVQLLKIVGVRGQSVSEYWLRLAVITHSLADISKKKKY